MSRNSMKSAFLAAVLLAGWPFAVDSVARAGAFAIVINSENGFAGGADEVKAQIKRLYLKEQKAWPNGFSAVPFGRDNDSPAQKAFEASVLSMADAALSTHWLRMKQTRGDTPPRGVGSVRILLRQIGQTQGAFGIVSRDELGGLPGNVKVLFEFD